MSEPDDRLRVLYHAGRRGEWRRALASSERIAVLELELRLRESVGLGMFVRVWRMLTASRRFRAQALLTEHWGANNVIPFLIACLLRVPRVIGAKGDPWAEFDEVRLKLPLGARLLKCLNHGSANLLLRRADTIVPLSESLAATLARRLGPRRRMRVVGIQYFLNGIEDSLKWIDSYGRYNNDRQRDEVKDLFRRGREAYAGLAQ